MRGTGRRAGSRFAGLRRRGDDVEAEPIGESERSEAPLVADPFGLQPRSHHARDVKHCSSTGTANESRGATSSQPRCASPRAGAALPAAEVAEIAARGDAQRGWLEVAPRDSFAVPVLLQCFHVAGVMRARLQAEGIGDERRFGALGFADRFGFYIVSPPAQPGEPGPGAPR